MPVTNGVATPLSTAAERLAVGAQELVTVSPGAITPCREIELLRLDMASGLPAKLQATTGMTHGWRVMAELPTVP